MTLLQQNGNNCVHVALSQAADFFGVTPPPEAERLVQAYTLSGGGIRNEDIPALCLLYLPGVQVAHLGMFDLSDRAWAVHPDFTSICLDDEENGLVELPFQPQASIEIYDLGNGTAHAEFYADIPQEREGALGSLIFLAKTHTGE